MNQELILILSAILHESKLCTQTANTFYCTFETCTNCILISHEDKRNYYVYKLIKYGERII